MLFPPFSNTRIVTQILAIKGVRIEGKGGNVKVRKAPFQSWVDMLFHYLEMLYAFGIFCFPTANFRSWSKVKKKLLITFQVLEHVISWPIPSPGYIRKMFMRVIHIFCHFSLTMLIWLCSGKSLRATSKEIETIDILG